MKSIESNLICIDKDCKLNRVITNWNDLQNHYHYQHKVYPQEKFEKKVNNKLSEYNQKFRMQIEQNISEQIADEEQQINTRVKSLFSKFQKKYFLHLQDQIKIHEQIESLSTNYQFDSNLKKYIEIYYNQFTSPQQQQVKKFLEETKYKFNGITKELINLIDEVELNYQIENQYSQNDSQKNQQEDFQGPKNNNSNSNSNQTYSNAYDYLYPQQQSNIDTNQLQQEDDQTNIPLRYYKNPQNQQQRPQYYAKEQQYKEYQYIQPSQFQQVQQQKPEQQYIEYIPKTEINNDNDDRIQFSLPSETTQTKKNNSLKIKLIGVQDLYEVEEEDQKSVDSSQNYTKQNQIIQEKYVVKETQQQQPQYIVKQQNELVQDDQSNQRNNIVGKKFDITNSDKHLKYQQRFTQYSCIQQGVALVEGAFTLNDNAKVKFLFTEPYEKILTASFGMQNVDNYGKKLGTHNFFMDQSGNLYKNEKPRKGTFKIDLNEEYILQYRGEKRLLSFKKSDNSAVPQQEYLHIEGSVSGSFKFYVKLYGLQVQIIK